jgi:hypothetical protein
MGSEGRMVMSAAWGTRRVHKINFALLGVLPRYSTGCHECPKPLHSSFTPEAGTHVPIRGPIAGGHSRPVVTMALLFPSRQQLKSLPKSDHAGTSTRRARPESKTGFG